MKNIFEYSNLRVFLRELASQFSVFSLREWRGQPGIILRHDVDLDIEPAWRLAKLEAEVGVRSTFFVLVTGEYNVASRINRRMIREISSLGFEVGLHFDPTIYDFESDDILATAAEEERSVLEGVVGLGIESISLHNPSVHGRYPLFPGWNNAYDSRIFAPDRYLSDSRMRFRSDPRKFLSGAREATFQLLLHPLHYSERGDPYPAAMLERIRRLAESVDTSFGVNSTYSERVGNEFFSFLARAATDWQAERERGSEK